MPDSTSGAQQSSRAVPGRSASATGVLRELQRRLQQASPGGERSSEARFSSGWAALDAVLAGGGLPRGGLSEWLGNGAASLALWAAGEAQQEGGFLVLVDRRRRFYPPAAACWGVCLARTLVLHPQDPGQQQWAVAQALRCPGVSAVWTETPDLPPRLLQPLLRRWQLAAEQGGAAGLLVRPASAIGEPHWAAVRLQVQPPGPAGRGPGDRQRPLRRFRLRVLRGAATAAAAPPELDLLLPAPARVRHDVAPHALPLAAQLAHPKTPRRSARA